MRNRLETADLTPREDIVQMEANLAELVELRKLLACGCQTCKKNASAIEKKFKLPRTLTAENVLDLMIDVGTTLQEFKRETVSSLNRRV